MDQIKAFISHSSDDALYINVFTTDYYSIFYR